MITLFKKQKKTSHQSHLVKRCDPFDPDRLSREKYSLQNMLMRQVNFPAQFSDEEFTYSGWSDHLQDKFRKAVDKHLNGKHGLFEGGQLLYSISDTEFLQFCRDACGVGARDRWCANHPLHESRNRVHGISN
jgi:hypothetical protein